MCFTVLGLRVTRPGRGMGCRFGADWRQFVGQVGNTGRVADDPVSVQVRRLVSDALEGFDSPGVTTSARVRKALRIAALRRDFAVQLGFTYQTIDLTAKSGSGPAPAVRPVRDQLGTLIDVDELASEMERQYQDYVSTRIYGDKGNIIGVSVSQLEDGLTALQRAYDDAEPAPGMTPIDTVLAADRASNPDFSLNVV